HEGGRAFDHRALRERTRVGDPGTRVGGVAGRSRGPDAGAAGVAGPLAGLAGGDTAVEGHRPMTSGTTLRRVTSLAFQKMNHTALVVDPRTRSVHLLNPTATRVWDLLEAPHTVEQLVTILGQEYDATEELLRGEVAPV